MRGGTSIFMNEEYEYFLDDEFDAPVKTKYDGIKKVEQGFAAPDHTVWKKKQKETVGGSYLNGLLLRIAAAVVFLCAVFSLKVFNNPVTEKVISTIKSAVCYDLDPREKQDYGYSEIFDKLFENWSAD